MIDLFKETLLEQDHDCSIIPVFSQPIEDFLLENKQITEGHYKFSCKFGKVKRGNELVLVVREIEIRPTLEVPNPNQQTFNL
jgi:hypothetical protein